MPLKLRLPSLSPDPELEDDSQESWDGVPPRTPKRSFCDDDVLADDIMGYRPKQRKVDSEPVDLPQLPTELLALIVVMTLPPSTSSHHEARSTHLRTLAQVNRTFRDISLKLLYAHLEIRSKRRFFLRAFELQHTFATGDGLARSVRSLKLDTRQSTETQQKLFGEVAERLASSCHGLEELYIAGFKKVNIHGIVAPLKNIKIVYVNSSGIIGPSTAPPPGTSSPLKYLSISRCRIWSTAFPPSSFSNLRGLSIVDPHYTSTETSSEALEAISLLVEVVAPNIEFLRYDLQMRTAFKDNLKDFVNLKVLDLTSCFPPVVLQPLPVVPKLLRVYASHHAVATFNSFIEDDRLHLNGIEKLVIRPCGCLPCPMAYADFQETCRRLKVELEYNQKNYSRGFWPEALPDERFYLEDEPIWDSELRYT